ncbi:hypothetical protein AAG906_012074 [Vitis piasezkii]
MERISILGFILAILYFITTELACNGYTHMSNNIQSEQEALIDFKSGLKDPNNRLSSWKGSNYCYWQGITCEKDTGIVISIDLHNPYPRENVYENWSSMNLSGEIRPSLTKLKSLKYLDLSFNSFKGMPIPQFFGSLKNLLYLNLSGAEFSGTIPSNFRSLSNLQYLDLSSEDFSYNDFEYFSDLSIGNIEWVTSLVSLKYLGMDFVNLSSIGSEWVEVLDKLPNLTELHLDGCSLSGGSISQLLRKSWKKIEFLSLARNDLHGPIPSSFGNFCNLKYLNLGGNYLNGSLPEIIKGIETCSSKSPLPNLTELYLDDSQLMGKLPNWLGELKNLRRLDLSWNELEGPIPSSFGNFCNLKYLNFEGNYLNGSLPEIIKGIETCSSKSPLPNLTFTRDYQGIETCSSKSPLPNLMELYLNENQLMGKLPNWLGELKILGASIYPSNSKLFWKLRNLKYLDLGLNYLNGSLRDYQGIETCSSKSPLPNLMELYLDYNQLMGKLPNWLGELKNLRDSIYPSNDLKSLSLGMNELNGSLPDSIGQLSELQVLDVGSNQLSGSLSEQHFWKLSKLEYLYMDSNSFHLNVSPNWVPPFQVKYLDMGSFHLGPSFPVWLQSQKNLQYLNFSNASISSHIPNWFWNISFNLQDLRLSHNQLQGQLPNSLKFSYSQIDFSSNLFEGPIPFSIKGVGFLDLSHNKFSGPIPLSRGESLSDLRYLLLSHNQITGPIPSNIGEFLPRLYFLSLSSNRITGTIPDSIGLITSLKVIDFSRNNLTGSIPSTINNCSDLTVLDLGNNNLSRMIPKSLGRLQLLQSLHLNNNKLSGELPSSFQNLSSLELLDLSYNELSGKVPSWIGTAFINLVILNLRSNAFFGRLPDRLSNLSSLHVLDLAQNNLTGKIPATLVELKAMAQERNMDMYSLNHYVNGSQYDERLIVITKGQSLEYTRTLSLVVSIDLSDNNLSGEFPEGITKLSGLVFLNLSMNHIIGQIPGSISMLCQLSSLDLSSNKLSGTIPSSMSSLTFLGYLNLSNNNFSGKIPFTGQMTTFTELAFAGNPNLCGTPLWSQNHWLGISVGILVPYFVLAIRRSWCDAYFDFVDKIVKWLLFKRRVTYAKNHARRQ